MLEGLDHSIWGFSEECLAVGLIQEVYYCYTDYQGSYRVEVSTHNCDNTSHNLYV